MWCTNAYTVIACIDMRNRYTWIQRYLCYLGIDIHGYNDIYATLVLDMHETYNVMFMIFTWPSYCHALVYRWHIHLVNVCIPRYNTPGIYVDFYFAYIYTTIYPTLCRNPQKWRAHTPTSSGSAITHRSPLFTGCHLVWPPSPPLLGCVTVSHTSLCLCLVLAIVLVGIAALWLLVYGCTSAHNTTQDVRWSSWDLYFTPTLCRNPQHLGTQGPLDSAALEKCSHDASMNFGGSKLRTIALGTMNCVRARTIMLVKHICWFWCAVGLKILAHCEYRFCGPPSWDIPLRGPATMTHANNPLEHSL